MFIYTKIEDATRSLYGNNTNAPTATDAKVKYTANNHLYEITEANIKKYKEFRTTSGLLFARNSGDVLLPDQQINVWVKKAGENVYVLAIGKEVKSNVHFIFPATASLASTKPFTYGDLSQTEITVTDGEAHDVMNGKTILNFVHGTGKTVKLFVNGTEIAFIDSADGCTAILDINGDTVVEVKDITA